MNDGNIGDTAYCEHCGKQIYVGGDIRWYHSAARTTACDLYAEPRLAQARLI